MYSAQVTKKRIMDLCKDQSAEQMLKECALGVNAIRQINDTKGMASFSLAKIADYLDVSVDYLLGRTENPKSHLSGNAVSVGDVSGNSGAIGVGNTVTNNAAPLDEHQKLLLDLYNKLSPIEQAKLLVYADTLKSK